MICLLNEFKIILLSIISYAFIQLCFQKIFKRTIKLSFIFPLPFKPQSGATLVTYNCTIYNKLQRSDTICPYSMSNSVSLLRSSVVLRLDSLLICRCSAANEIAIKFYYFSHIPKWFYLLFLGMIE